MAELSEKIERINNLVLLLNHYRDMYYNQAKSEISDIDYDNLYDELNRLEKETGYMLINSPTRTVGYSTSSSLVKVKHNHPMLSLDKTKNILDVVKYFNGHDIVCMAKMDGLTCSLHYVGGQLVSAETRGDGTIGEDVTHNALVIPSIPKTIKIEDDVVIDGEIIIAKDDFDEINSTLPDEKKYKNPRNLAAGSISLLDSLEAQTRHMQFVAWKFVSGSKTNSFYDSIMSLIDYGFTVCPIVKWSKDSITEENLLKAVEIIKKWNESFPLDGCVFGFDDISYGDSLGMTGHHVRSQLAYKFYDETIPTKLKYIDWTIGKTGVLTPTAVFNPVKIDGTDVSRASLHNVSIINELGLTNNCTVYVYKANMIIPQVNSCDNDGDGPIEYPTKCPICGGHTGFVRDNESENLVCKNPFCSGKTLAMFEHFVSRKCANIDGLSSSKLQELIDNGYIKTFKDIYHLSDYENELKSLKGWGEKSVSKLLESINKSRTIKLDNYINSLGIYGVGYASAKLISDVCEGDPKMFYKAIKEDFDFTLIDGFGKAIDISIKNWGRAPSLADDLMDEFNFIMPEKPISERLQGVRFCITGTFSEPRDVIVKKLTSRGAVFVSGISKKLDVLFCGENSGSKLDKANALGIKVVTESEMYSEYIGDENN